MVVLVLITYVPTFTLACLVPALAVRDLGAEAAERGPPRGAKRVTIEQIHPGLYRITTPFDTTGTVFLYLLKGDRLALIDTGASDSRRLCSNRPWPRSGCGCPRWR